MLIVSRVIDKEVELYTYFRPRYSGGDGTGRKVSLKLRICVNPGFGEVLDTTPGFGRNRDANPGFIKNHDADPGFAWMY